MKWDESNADAARDELGPGGSRSEGRGEGRPPESAPESPALGAGPTHLAREIVARPAGWGALEGLSIPGGRGARRARHVPGPEVSWGPRRPRDRQEPPRLKLRPLLPSTAPGRDPDRLLPPFCHLNNAGGELAVPRGRAGPQSQLSRGQAGPQSRASRRV